MPAVKRVFSGSSVEMLTVLQIIAAHALENKARFQENLSTYDDPYFEDLGVRIEKIMTEYFGKDAGRLLREATAIIQGIQKEAYHDLGLFKTLLEQQFDSDKTTLQSILKTLGYADSYKEIRNKSQEDLVQLLFQFRKNLDADLKAKIVKAGIRPAIMDRIVDKTDQLSKANVSQEVFKNNKKADTQEGVLQFNAIYTEVIGLSKQSRRLFKDDAALKDKFNYGKNLKALTGDASPSTAAKKAKEKKALQTA